MSTTHSILIVDDNPNNLSVLSGILNADGFKVRPALSGEMALRAIEIQHPDLILLDIRMPGMDGYETCRQLKAHPATQDIPVLFISALNEIGDKLLAFRAGGVDYLSKPFQAEEVLARVRTQLSLSDTRKSLAATNAQLRAMMEQLVQAEKLKSLEFLAAGVAHELNTPIGNAMLGADTLATLARECTAAQAQGAAPAMLQELLITCLDASALILRNLQRARKLINSLKEVSVDRASERRRQVNLHTLVGDVLAVLHGHVGKTPYTIKLDMADDLVLETYPGHLEQIVENLIHNAIIHGFGGAPAGTITVSGSKTPQGQIALTVADNGRGIAQANLSKVFDPFFTTRLGQGGSGLGLHIVYTLATGILGGHISVASTPGAGARFTVTLPQCAPDAPAPSPAPNTPRV